MTQNPDPVFASPKAETNPSIASVEEIMFRSNMINGETPTTEMPLFTHNAPMAPNPSSYPGEVFIDQLKIFRLEISDSTCPTSCGI